MSDQKNKPVRSLFKYCWYFLAVLIILIALVIQTARWLSPSVHLFKDSIESFASEQLNSNVTIGQISAKWEGLTPKISIEDLSIHHQAAFITSQSSNRNRNFLNIKFASLEMDILKSIFYRTPVWRHVEANGLAAQLVQNELGTWSLGDFASKNNISASNWRYRSPSALFLTTQDVSLENAQFTLLFSDKRELITSVPSIALKNNGHFHRLEAQASISQDSSFKFIVEGVGDPSIPDKFFAKAYLKMENFAEEALVDSFSQLMGFDIEQEWVRSSSADLELWFDFASTNRFLMNGHVALKNVESVIDELTSETNNEWRADIIGSYRPSAGLSVGVRNAVVDESFTVPPFLVNLNGDSQLDIGIEAIDLERLNQWVVNRLFRLSFFNSDRIPLEKIKEVLSSLDLRGKVHDLSLSVDLLDIKNSTISAIADNVSSGVWKNVPAFANVSGYVESGFNNGFIVIDARQFSLFPKAVYQQPIEAGIATGIVGWELDYQQKEVDVFGYGLSLQGDHGDARGNFLLDLNWRREPDKNNLTLQLGLKNSKARFHQRLIPRSLPKGLLSWMDRAIKGGDLRQTGVFYHGGFARRSPRTVQAFVDIEQGRLRFDSNWPEAKEIDVDLLIDNARVFAKVNNASAYSNESFSGDVHWNAELDNKLLIDIDGIASTHSALRYIKESLLKENLGNVVDQVSASTGNIEVATKLALFFDNGAVDTNLSTQLVDLRFINNTLKLDAQNLSFKAIKGSLGFSNKKGFSSKGLGANFLGKPVSIKVHEDKQRPNTLFISGKGRAAVGAIKDWLDQPLLDYWKGTVNYDINLQFPRTANTKTLPLLSISSNLVGVESDLPKPFKKTSSDKMMLDFQLPFLEENPVFELSIGSYFTTKFSVGDKSKGDKGFTGFLGFSDTEITADVELPSSGIKLLGKFQDFQFNEWLPVFESLSNGSDIGQSPGQSIFDASLFLTIDNLYFNDQVLKNIIFSGERENNGWRIIADNHDVLGSLMISDNHQRPLIMEFDYLNWPPNYTKNSDKDIAFDKDEANKNTDPLDEFDPSSLPEMSITVNRLNLFGNPLGRWSFDVLPDKQGVDFRNIYADVSGFNLKGVTDSDGGFLRWNTRTQEVPLSTSIYGRVVGKNPKILFEQWNLPVALESDKTEIDFNLSWPGSPLAIELESLNGSMTHHYEDGVFSQENIDDSSGILRVFGLLNFDSWARRVRLDFSDIYKKGIIFDSLDGQLSFNQGIMTLTEPLTMKGPSSEMTLSGVVDYPRQTVDVNLEASLPIGGNLTLITALAAGLPVAAGVYIASKIFKKQINSVSSINYDISGDLNNPNVNVEQTRTEREIIAPDGPYEKDGS